MNEKQILLSKLIRIHNKLANTYEIVDTDSDVIYLLDNIASELDEMVKFINGMELVED